MDDFGWAPLRGPRERGAQLAEEVAGLMEVAGVEVVLATTLVTPLETAVEVCIAASWG